MRFPFSLRRPSKLEGAAWLSERLLLLTGRLGYEEEDHAAFTSGGESETPLETHAASHHANGDGGGADRTTLLIAFPEGSSPRFGLRIRTDRRSVRISDEQLARATTDVRSFASRLTRAEAGTRRRLHSLIAEGCAGELDRTGSYALARNLDLVRQELRPPPRPRMDSVVDRQALQVEQLLAIDERSVWIRGWAGDRVEGDVEAWIMSPEGHRIAPLEGAHRHSRPDVDQALAGAEAFVPGIETGTKHGFVRFAELATPTLMPSTWVAQVRDPAGEITEEETPCIARDLISVRNGILTDVKDFARLEPGDELLCKHAHPALTRLQERLNDSARIDAVTQYGSPPASAELSVIVPLYGRIDFMEHQLSQFVHDVEFREIDLIYVLDSPELAAELERTAAALHALYELPFRTAILNRNAGYAIANNLAASLARGRLLVLLNSDVLPDARGWVRTMAAFYDATPAIGALGPKLLYEDGSLQHAGMYFERDAGAPLWTNLHYFKGLESAFRPANVARPVPAVTGACLMIARSLWAEMGGLRPHYVQGGYEDSDLCLRLIEAGRDNWYLPPVTLRHLEDQSFPSEARKMATAYNTWLQTHLWGARIEELMRDERFSASP